MTKQEPAGLNTTNLDVIPLSEVIKNKRGKKLFITMNNVIKLSVVLWGISRVIMAVFDLAWQYQYGGGWVLN